MLDSLRCQSAEKLVIDAEAIASALRLVRGIALSEGSLGLDAIREAGFAGRFLELPETRRRFREEQHLPSAVVDRGSLRAWLGGGSRDMFERARSRVDALLAEPSPTTLDAAVAGELVGRVADALRAVGFDGLPGVAAGTAAAVPGGSRRTQPSRAGLGARRADGQVAGRWAPRRVDGR